MPAPSPRSASLLILACLSMLACPAGAQQGPDPDSPRWKGVMALQELFASEGDAAIDAFIAERVAPAALAEHGEADVRARLLELRAHYGGREMTGASPEGQFAARLEFGDEGLIFELEPQPPHRFLQIEPLGAAALEREPITWENLETRLAQEAERGFAGSVLVVRDGEVVLNEGYGLANREAGIPNTPETIFAIGSTPIDFTKAGILLLMDEGKVSPSDPITKYFDDVPSDKRSITVDHLMTGRSGLRDFHDLPTDRDPDHSWIDRDEAVRRILDQELLFPPGEGRRHSHSAWGLLAAIIEIAGGQSYPEFTRTRLFEPAGMKDTGFFGEDYPENRMAIGYGDVTDGEVNAPPYWGRTSWLVMGSGGQVSTTGDMLRWHEALRAGKILPPDMLERYFERRGALLNGGDQYGFEIFYTQGPDSMMILTSNTGASPALGRLARDLADLVGAGALPKFSLGVAMDVRDDGTVRIDRVVPGSAAERDGLRAGDVMITAGGKPLSPDPLAVLDPYLETGEAIEFVVQRDGDRLPITVTPSPR